MEVLMSKMVEAMRISMDEVNHDEMNDIFADDSEEEMKSAVSTAATQILLQAPNEALMPQRVKASLREDGSIDYDAIQTQYTDGHGTLDIPDDWLKLCALKLKSWQSVLFTLMESDSKEAQMQACRWTRGTPQKPKGMITVSPTTGKRELMYWTAGRYDANHAPVGKVYNHEVEYFTYIPYPKLENVYDEADTKKVVDQELIIPLVDCFIENVVYRAISIFLVSKKEPDLADKYNQLSQF